MDTCVCTIDSTIVNGLPFLCNAHVFSAIRILCATHVTYVKFSSQCTMRKEASNLKNNLNTEQKILLEREELIVFQLFPSIKKKINLSDKTKEKI